jgi:hypothetical protein
MIFMSTTSTTICRGALQRKSNAAVTFTDAQSDSSFVIVHHMLGRANIYGWASMNSPCSTWLGPGNPSIVRPVDGGANRKLFWIRVLEIIAASNPSYHHRRRPWLCRLIYNCSVRTLV